MNNWISALADLQQQGEPCVLVTIIEERGSTPRNAGSKMVISATRTFDTIGGGHLEYKAMSIARDMLEGGKQDTQHQPCKPFHDTHVLTNLGQRNRYIRSR